MIVGQTRERPRQCGQSAPFILLRPPGFPVALLIVGHPRLYSPWMTHDDRNAQETPTANQDIKVYFHHRDGWLPCLTHDHGQPGAATKLPHEIRAKPGQAQDRDTVDTRMAISPQPDADSSTSSRPRLTETLRLQAAPNGTTGYPHRTEQPSDTRTGADAAPLIAGTMRSGGEARSAGTFGERVVLDDVPPDLATPPRPTGPKTQPTPRSGITPSATDKRDHWRQTALPSKVQAVTAR